MWNKVLQVFDKKIVPNDGAKSKTEEKCQQKKNEIELRELRLRWDQLMSKSRQQV